MVETRVATPQPLPIFQEYFARHDKSFSQAALAWAEDRRVLFPFGDGTIDTQINSLVQETVSTFDDQILSSRFSAFTPHLARAASIICWSEGDREIQRKKVGAVKARWQDAGINPNTVLELIGEAKMESVSDVIMQAETIKETRFGPDSKSLPIVIIEDKITNMMKFMREYIAISPLNEKIEIPAISEDELDKENFAFDEFLTTWKQAIDQHLNNFRRFRFVYVPPEKQFSADSALRAERVKAWITASNEALKDSRARGSVVPQLAGILYKYTPDQFFHIEDTTTDLSKVITPRSIVVADVDGPLVSQSRVLATRESVLQAAYKRLLEATYLKTFMVDFEKLGTYFLFPTDDFAVVFQENVDSNATELGIGAKYLRMNHNAGFWKELLPGKVRVTFRRINHEEIKQAEEIIFDIEPTLLRSAMNSLGYRVHFTDMLI